MGLSVIIRNYNEIHWDNNMPINVSWFDNDQTIIIIDYVAPYLTTWDEYHEGINESVKLAESVKHELVIILIANGAKMPQGQALQHINQAILRLPKNVLTAISLMPQSSIHERLILSVLRRVGFLQKRVSIASSWEDAMNIVERFGISVSAQTRIARSHDR